MTGVNSDNHRIVRGAVALSRRDAAVAVGHRGDLIAVKGIVRWCGRLWTAARRGVDRRAGGGALFAGNGKHDLVIVAVALRNGARFTGPGQLKHQPNALRIFRLAGANAFHQIIAAEIQRQPLNYAGLTNIQHHAVRVMQREEAVDGLAVKAQRHRCLTIAV